MFLYKGKILSVPVEKNKIIWGENDFFMAFQKGVIFLQIRAGYCVLSDYISAGVNIFRYVVSNFAY